VAPMDSSSQSDITYDEIAARAHLIWEQSGGLDGYDTENWLRAERELRSERGQGHEISQGMGTSEKRPNRAKV
jgi:Protein of unknown function (DUF2934)